MAILERIADRVRLPEVPAEWEALFEEVVTGDRPEVPHGDMTTRMDYYGAHEGVEKGRFKTSINYRTEHSTHVSRPVGGSFIFTYEGVFPYSD